MENASISSTLEDLRSNKTKERNNALEELTSALKQSPDLIPTKALSPTCETLIELLDEEHRKYCNILATATESSEGKLSLSENRLSSVAYVLRLLIEKTCSRFKLKTLRLLPAVLPELMVKQNSRSLLEPVSVHLTFALYALIRSKLFQLKLALHQWVSLVEIACLYLDERLDVSLVDRNVSNLISILDGLLSIDCVGLSQVASTVHRTVMKYLRLSEKQDANTRLIVSIINQLVLKTHCFNIKETLRLIKETWKHFTMIDVTTNESIQSELSYLDIYASHLIFNSIPSMLGNEEAEFEPYETSLIPICREYVITRLVGYKAQTLSTHSFKFSGNIGEKISFFEFDDFQLKESADIDPWLRIMSITRLLISYFKLLQRNSSELHIFKKRKYEMNLPSILRNSQTISSFLCTGLLSDINEVEMTTMQVVAFAAAMHDIDGGGIRDLMEIITSKFENVGLIKWICLALIPILTQKEISLSDEEMNRLFKICLPLIKQPEICSISCALLTTVMKYSDCPLSDKTTIGQLSSVYELSDVNGPSIPCNEAFVFWEYLQTYGAELELLSLQSISCKVLDWVKAKWNLLVNPQEDQNKFYEFLAWLCNRRRFGMRSIKTSGVYRTLNWKGPWQQRYHRWLDQLETRSFILQEKPITKSARNVPRDKTSDNFIADKLVIGDILYRLLELIEGDSGLEALARFRWISQVSRLAGYLAGDSNHLDYLLDFQRAASTAFTHVKFQHEEDYRYFFEETLSIEEAAPARLVFQNLPMNKIANEFKQLLSQDYAKELSEKSRAYSLSVQLASVVDAYECKGIADRSTLALSVEALLHVLKSKEADLSVESWDLLMTYVSTFSTEQFVACLPPLIDWIAMEHKNWPPNSHRLEDFTEVLSEHLLQGDFSTSSIGAYYLCSYLDSISSAWLNTIGSPLNADCNDILDWIISRFEETAFSGTLAVKRFSQLLLHMLKNHDLSRGCVKGGKQRIFAVFSKSLRVSNIHEVVNELATIAKYMRKLSNKNQRILFAEITALMEAPQQSIEMSAMYALGMLNMSTASHTNLILSLKDLLHYTGFQHTRVYIASAIQAMTSHLALVKRQQLFNTCSYDVIAQWLDDSSDSDKTLADVCDVEIFGFDGLSQFFRLYTAELAALCFARSPNNSSIMSEIVKLSGKSAQQLFLDYYHLAIPLSFVTGGIGEAIYDLLHDICGRSFFKTQSQLLIYRFVLRFLDLGSNYDTGIMIEKYYSQNSRAKGLYPSRPNDWHYQHPLHIPLATGLGLLRQVHERHSFCKEEVNFLLMWILSDLTSTANFPERQRCLREMKLALAVNEELLASCGSLSNFMSPLSRYLMDNELHDEVSDILVFLLHIAQDTKSTTTDELLHIFCHVFRFKRMQGKEVSPPLKEALKQITHTANRCQRTLGFCNDAVDNRTLSTDVYENLEILETDSFDESNILLLSLLFEYAEKPGNIVFTEGPSTCMMQNLLRVEVPLDLASENFQLWIAYLMKAFNATNNAKYVFAEQITQSAGIYDVLFDNFGSFTHLIDAYLAIEDRSLLVESCLAKFFCQSLTALIVHNPHYKEEKAMIMKSRVHYEIFENNCLPVTEHVFSSIHHMPSGSTNMIRFLDDAFLDEKISYFEWLVKLDTALLDQLCQSIPNVKLFRPLLSLSISFAESALPILFNLMICFDHKSVIEWSSRIFSCILELIKCHDGNKKIESCLCVVKMMMTGKRLEERHCTSCFSRLPLKLICEAARESNQVTFAYMLYEMLYMTDQCNMDIGLLRVIYDSLDDINLIAGLPAPHTLMGALDVVSVIEPDTRKNFMFNNALLDANFPSSGQVHSSRLLKASEYQGFYGIANCLSKAQLSSELDCDYKWALQLGKWDLPAPQQINTKEEGLYYTLKRVSHEAPHPSKILEDSIVQLVRSRADFRNPLEWAETIAEVVLLQEISDNMRTSDSLAKTLSKTFASDREALYVSDFGDYKSNVQSRYVLSKLLSNRSDDYPSISGADLKLGSAALLANYVELAVREKCPQDAMKNAVMLNSLVQQDFEPLKLGRLQSFISAVALWECNDIKTPVMIMKDLLSDKSFHEAAEGSLNSLIEVSNDKVQALLVKWTSKSRLETASTIFETYVNNFETSIKDHESRAEIFYILANFLEGQVRRMRDHEEIEERKKRCERGLEELRSLETLYQNSNVSENERKDAKRHHGRLALQLSSDKEILNTLLVQQVQFVWRSLHYFINTMVFTNKYDNDVLDKFCGLWFEHDGNDTINSLLRKEVGLVPSWKFLPWVNQISSKLSIEETEFQKPLQLTMKRLLYKLPYHSLYSVLSMKLYEKYSFTADSIIPQKIQAVNKMLHELRGYDNGSYHRAYVAPLQEFCEMSVELASFQLQQSNSNKRKLHLKNVKIGEYWLKRLPHQKIPLPTMKWQIKSSNDGKAPMSHIVSVQETVEISTTGLSLPKIVTFILSDGSRHKVLMKGSNDDLRQDAIMEQVFQQVNDVLQRDKQIRKLELNISTYNVIPLGPRAGIIEYVTNSLSLHQILAILHKKDSTSFNQARKEMKSAQTRSNNERLRTYTKLTQEIKPQLRNFFFDSFPNSNDWFRAKKTFTRGTATNSIVGYILGLGDRHLNNILLDHHTGKPTHIDLGIAFDQGRLLPIPEMVPFRLTRDIVDGFGVTGVEGLFRRSCEHTYAVLRENYDKVMHVLNILKWDPLYSWAMSPIKKHKHLLETESQDYSDVAFGGDGSKTESKEMEQNQQSYRALKGVEEKLIGNGLNVEATVQELIQQASDPRNLSVIYMGWSPFY